MSSDSMLKYFIACLALCSLVYADGEWVPPTFDEYFRITDKCHTEHPFKKEQYAMIAQNHGYIDEPEVRQYLLCYHQMIGFFSTHEGFHVDRLVKRYKKNLGEEETLQIVQSCVDRNEQQSPVDEWVFRVDACLDSSKIFDRTRAVIAAVEAKAAAKAKKSK